jgi:hypothetical protein
MEMLHYNCTSSLCLLFLMLRVPHKKYSKKYSSYHPVVYLYCSVQYCPLFIMIPYTLYYILTGLLETLTHVKDTLLEMSLGVFGRNRVVVSQSCQSVQQIALLLLCDLDFILRLRVRLRRTVLPALLPLTTHTILEYESYANGIRFREENIPRKIRKTTRLWNIP